MSCAFVKESVQDGEGAMIEFHTCRLDEEPGARLLQAMRDEIAELYDGLALDDPAMPKAGPAELGPPGGAFLVGFEDGVPVCCGGVKRLPDGACEIKRMFVVPEARGRGVARALLEELERRARVLGYAVARLDTGPRQPRAQRMYERAGYLPIANFNANPVATFFGEKRL
jgi:GNAT superfamily N-acetyltransferase